MNYSNFRREDFPNIRRTCLFCGRDDLRWDRRGPVSSLYDMQFLTFRFSCLYCHAEMKEVWQCASSSKERILLYPNPMQKEESSWDIMIFHFWGVEVIKPPDDMETLFSPDGEKIEWTRVRKCLLCGSENLIYEPLVIDRGAYPWRAYIHFQCRHCEERMTGIWEYVSSELTSPDEFHIVEGEGTPGLAFRFLGGKVDCYDKRKLIFRF